MHGLSWVIYLKIPVFLTAFEGSIMLYLQQCQPSVSETSQNRGTLSKCSILSRGSVRSCTLQFLADVKAACVILIVVTRWSHSSHTWTGCWNAVTDTQLKTTANSLHTHSHSAEHIKASDSSGQLSWQKSNNLSYKCLCCSVVCSECADQMVHDSVYRSYQLFKQSRHSGTWLWQF